MLAQGQEPVRWLADSHPSAERSAKVLATFWNATLRRLSEPVCSALESLGLSERPWLIHLLVGDGVGTNEAAAKILIAWLRAQPWAARVRYFLLVVKCANHQANLAIGSAVSGKTALAGSRYAGSLEAPLVARALAHAKKSVATEVCGFIGPLAQIPRLGLLCRLPQQLARHSRPHCASSSFSISAATVPDVAGHAARVWHQRVAKLSLAMPQWQHQRLGPLLGALVGALASAARVLESDSAVVSPKARLGAVRASSSRLSSRGVATAHLCRG